MTGEANSDSLFRALEVNAKAYAAKTSYVKSRNTHMKPRSKRSAIA
jgi:hypothetical protein